VVPFILYVEPIRVARIRPSVDSNHRHTAYEAKLINAKNRIFRRDFSVLWTRNPCKD
jgi:hypothetical protein